MSLYNMLFGFNKTSPFLLSMLNLTTGDTGRFRDCYLARGDRYEREEAEKDEAKAAELAKKDLRIVVYTRNGGGNREDYAAVTDALQVHPCYLTDYDDDFDCTYASYEFKVPEVFKLTAEELATLGGEPGVSPQEKFRSLIEKMQTGKEDDPEVKRAFEVGKQILAPVVEKLKEG